MSSHTPDSMLALQVELLQAKLALAESQDDATAVCTLRVGLLERQLALATARGDGDTVLGLKVDIIEAKIALASREAGAAPDSDTTSSSRITTATTPEPDARAAQATTPEPDHNAAAIWTRIVDDPFTLSNVENEPGQAQERVEENDVEENAVVGDLLGGGKSPSPVDGEDLGPASAVRPTSTTSTAALASDALKSRGSTLELTSDEEELHGVRVKSRSSVRKRRVIEEAEEDSGDDDDELHESSNESSAAKSTHLEMDAPNGPDEDFAVQFMRWVGWIWAWAARVDDGRELVGSMIGPLVRIELALGFTQGEALPDALPYMKNWASKRRMACKIDHVDMYDNPSKKDAYTPNFEHKTLACWSLIRSQPFSAVAQMTGRYGMVLVVRSLVQARASGILVHDWALYVREVAALLEAVRRYREDDEIDGDCDDTVLVLMQKWDPVGTAAVSDALDARARELAEIEGARKTRPAPASPSQAGVKLERKSSPSKGRSNGIVRVAGRKRTLLTLAPPPSESEDSPKKKARRGNAPA
ncbi:unnamed protein product [Peniophora sp. CBMAI 1063]|nr:unnamed protein product [Peniophora sp. CBMAI 1063]